MAKLLIIGPSLSGKTSLVKLLRENNDYNVAEIDEWLTDFNSGEFPKDVGKKALLFKKVFSKLLEIQNIIFFSNVWYFDTMQIEELKSIGFKIVLLKSKLNTLRERNKVRIKMEYEDMEKYLKDMIQYGEEIKGFIDLEIDIEDPIKELVSHIKEFYKS